MRNIAAPARLAQDRIDAQAGPEFKRRQGDLDARDVRLLQCSAGALGTRLKGFDPAGPLFADQALREALVAAEDAAVVQAAVTRRWMDG